MFMVSEHDDWTPLCKLEAIIANDAGHKSKIMTSIWLAVEQKEKNWN